MQRIVTTVAGPLFWIGLTVAIILVTWKLINVWKKYIKVSKQASTTDTAPPLWPIPVILTLLLAGGLMLLSTIIWNAMQSETTNASSYTSPAERNYHEQIISSNLPTNEQLNQTRADLKNRAETQPHQKALDDFDAKIAAEHIKIVERSLNRTNTKKQ